MRADATHSAARATRGKRSTGTLSLGWISFLSNINLRFWRKLKKKSFESTWCESSDATINDDKCHIRIAFIVWWTMATTVCWIKIVNKKKNKTKHNTLILLRCYIQSTRATALTADPFIASVWQTLPRYAGYQQHDAHEFLVSLHSLRASINTNVVCSDICWSEWSARCELWPRRRRLVWHSTRNGSARWCSPRYVVGVVGVSLIVWCVCVCVVAGQGGENEFSSCRISYVRYLSPFLCFSLCIQWLFLLLLLCFRNGIVCIDHCTERICS